MNFSIILLFTFYFFCPEGKKEVESVYVNKHFSALMKIAIKNSGERYIEQLTEKDLIKIINLYKTKNRKLIELEFGRYSVLTTVHFFLRLDISDGMADFEIEEKEAKELHHLLLEREISPSKIIFNKRGKNRWREITSFFDRDFKVPKEILVLKNLKISDLEKIKKVRKFIKKKIRSTKDVLGKDFWQFPEETLLRGRGDCEDFAILFQAIAKFLGIKTTFVIGTIDVRMFRFLPDKKEFHAWCEYKEIIFDCAIFFKMKKNRYSPIKKIDIIAKGIDNENTKTKRS